MTNFKTTTMMKFAAATRRIHKIKKNELKIFVTRVIPRDALALEKLQLITFLKLTSSIAFVGSSLN